MGDGGSHLIASAPEIVSQMLAAAMPDEQRAIIQALNLGDVVDGGRLGDFDRTIQENVSGDAARAVFLARGDRGRARSIFMTLIAQRVMDLLEQQNQSEEPAFDPQAAFEELISSFRGVGAGEGAGGGAGEPVDEIFGTSLLPDYNFDPYSRMYEQEFG